MQIDVYQDLTCPWCRIGKHNLDQALKEWTGPPVTVTYRPFFLDETVPVENRAHAIHPRVQVVQMMQEERFRELRHLR